MSQKSPELGALPDEPEDLEEQERIKETGTSARGPREQPLSKSKAQDEGEDLVTGEEDEDATR